ncbi:glycoside hydrolase family 53 protein [Amorphotheca resinae ATCC 22711]|uniref:Arabinogalactan endo-beta-1,4-galactanase n=1 Tax=Amorphotheca resinae ATCC 22711 TaxID=857342 RepID=A0A2T3B359_AMORE|nr:glycoside hydrolase family 53 protein [Amorphotheca resinae ATCC 22711]PSS20070.1 glycoside hydrolase family 53 protein [Amorphotheca resinae ATCC 22711]
MYLWSFILLVVALVAATPQSAGQDMLQPFFYKGHDLSSLKMLEEGGYVYKDTARNNQTRAAEDILGDGGMNSVRLRIWVNPVGGTYGLQYNLDLAKRFQDKGYKIYLDFHFSDSWADPNKQPPPAAWPKTLGPLALTLRQYVKDTLVSFHDAGIDLSLVALGNEIRHGMLWPLGYADVDVEPWPATVANFSNLATLWKAARAGVDDAIFMGVPKPAVLIHIDDGWNLTLQQRWFGALTENGIPTTAWDVFGFSFYPFYGTAATFDNLRTTLHTLAKEYGKPLQVVETDYPAICNGEFEPIPPSSEPEIPYSIAGQTSWTDDVISIVQQVPYGLGQGIHYWEPAWLNNTSLGSDCNDAILFTADYSNLTEPVGYSRSSVGMFRVK